MGKRNALVIIPNFYTYPEQIKKELCSRGYNVYILYEQPSRMTYLLLKKVGSFVGNKTAFYLFNRSILNKVKKMCNLDLLLVIRGNVLAEETILAIKKKLTSNAKTIYYSWDSFSHLLHNGKIGLLFDKRATFDSVDANNRKKEGWELIPLFYGNEYNVASEEYKPQFDLCSIGSFMIDRYRMLKTIKESNPNLKMYGKLYLDKKLYYIKWIKEKEYRSLDMDLISFDSFSDRDIVSKALKSKCILDITSVGQTGLTMRTIESIGLRKKLVTNNEYIKEYDIYNMSNVLVIDKSKTKIPNEWIDREYEIDDYIRKKYSIMEWMNCLLS